MKKRHPYNFVPFAEKLERKALKATGNHERYRGHSGTATCELRTLTPLCLKKHFADLERQNAAPFLPASSLKGMARNVAEILGAGCGLLFVDEKTPDPRVKRSRGREAPRDRIPVELGGFEPCTMDEACVVCRVFGYAPQGDRARREEERITGWAGKVRFRDSKPAVNWDCARWHKLRKGSAKWQAQGAWHASFYFPDFAAGATKQKPAGWKVYLHADRVRDPDPTFRPDACVDKDEVFIFEVDYENLDDEEFAVLKFALTLQHECGQYPEPVRLCHKLGYGKPIGLGSCEIAARWEKVAVKRYFAGDARAPEEDAGCAIHPYLKLAGFKAMREYLSWERRAAEIKYPDYAWFLDNARATITEYEDELNAAAAYTPPPEPEPEPEAPPEVEIPNVIEVTIKRVIRGKTEFETVDAFDGHVYTGKASNSLLYTKPGDTCHLRVQGMDHRTKTLTGRVEW